MNRYIHTKSEKRPVASFRNIALYFVLAGTVCLLLLHFPGSCAALSIQVKGTWLGRQWLQDFDPAKLETLVRDIKRYRITAIYPALSFGPATPMPGTDKIGWINFSVKAKRFIKEIRNRCPGVRIIPYKGARVCGKKFRDKDGKVVIRSLWNDVGWRERAINALVNSTKMLDADGIQFDLECNDIDNPANKAGLESFFRKLKNKIGTEKVLSVAIPILSQDRIDYQNNEYRKAPWKESLLSATASGRMGRAPHVYEIIFETCDEVAIMYYDTWISNGNTQRFIDLIAAQSWASAWFSQRFGGEFLVGIRLSTTKGIHRRSGGIMHDYRIENPFNSNTGLLQALHRPLEGGKYVKDFLRGIMIFRLDVIYEKGWKKDIGSRYLITINELLKTDIK